MALDKKTEQALRTGRVQAAAVVSLRTAALRRRNAVLKQANAAGPQPKALNVKPQRAKAAGADASVGVLVAEGDSWFDYPFFDLLSLLEDEFGYDVRHVAHKGDRVEDMAYGSNGAGPESGAAQLAALTRLIEKLIREGRMPRAILLSGGGNDIAGTEFAMLLEHKHSVNAGLNTQVVKGVIDQRLRLSYVTLLSAITRVCELRAGLRIPILLHGYDYPVPDGRGYLGGWGFLPGPWLEPGFRQKGYDALEERAGIARDLIDRFNAMLKQVAGIQAFAHVRYVDLRGTLATGPGYKQLWDNELHPTRKGFQLVCRKVAKAIAALPKS